MPGYLDLWADDVRDVDGEEDDLGPLGPGDAGGEGGGGHPGLVRALQGGRALAQRGQMPVGKVPEGRIVGGASSPPTGQLACFPQLRRQDGRRLGLEHSTQADSRGISEEN